ncbi:putative transposase [Streptomyces sp. TLI_053]|uniref:Mu transposase C-terminal domain-containing protein n=1 Tax=Streptomyces sp. TLI_053 TaxID=1855352 RepID=UPI00087CB053|nr:Mu transposase C-terminal domain-containing protein [Streptomyces sp. TLI_053]SDS49674.1 putative transposase [Streptomyces sp. TLI_053]
MNPPLPPEPSTTELRAAGVRRLLHLHAEGQLTATHISLTAATFGVTPRTVHRWIANARTHHGHYTPTTRDRFTLTPDMHTAIARHRGNVAAAYQELRDETPQDTPPLPSRATFYRAVEHDIPKGQRAGLAGGEQARRRHDLHGTRPRGHRNQYWETDHVEASVRVVIDNRIVRKPWITWFVDAATNAICGLAVSPQYGSSESILLALRDALLRTPGHGPFGGLPGRVRVDGGKDFLSNAVGQALAAFGVELVRLPPRRPDLKPHVEAVNGAVKDMLFKGLPGYTHDPAAPRRKNKEPEHLLTLESFVLMLREWVTRWNTEHTIPTMGGRTPAQAWNEDLSPVWDVSPTDVHTFTLARHGNALTIHPAGVRWRNRDYTAPWMHTPTTQVGRKVHLRYMPHHEDEIELYDAATGRHLGQARPADQATPKEVRALLNARSREADRLRSRLRDAEKSRNERFAALTQPAPPRHLLTITHQEATRELRELNAHDTAGEALPDYIPLPQPSAHWTTPLGNKPTAHPATDPESNEDT